MPRVSKFILIGLSGRLVHALKPGTGSYLNGLPLNLICPTSIVSQGRNNTHDITISRLRVDLT
jgi:hypothetical protein